MLLYINYPSFIHPSIFPGIPILSNIRWYGLMYIVAFALAFFVFKKLVKEGAFQGEATIDEVASYMTTSVVCLLVGARVFSTLVYDTSGIYLKNPLLIFWPFDSSGHFSGLAGMSYHGGFIGGFLGMLFWLKRHKKSFIVWGDATGVAIPLGYTFGRLGNFFNGELFGRITTVPWGVVFPKAEKFSLSFDWVKDFALKAGMNVADFGVVNLPRHPSQLYEAFFEGIVLFCLLWFLRKKKPFPGFLGALYIIGYSVFRFMIEYLREPDLDIGYRFSLEAGQPLYLNTSLLNISTGQVLCLIMFLFGICYGIFCYLHNKKVAKEINTK